MVVMSGQKSNLYCRILIFDIFFCKLREFRSAEIGQAVADLRTLSLSDLIIQYLK